MTAFADFLETGLREHFKRDTQLPLEDTYLALFTADPGEGTSLTGEVSGGAYARVQVYQATTTTPYWTNHTTGIGIQNLQAVAFAQATSAWGTITNWAVMDAATAGNKLFVGALASSKVVGANDTFSFAVGNFKIKFD